jgi:adenylosuccinate lyase
MAVWNDGGTFKDRLRADPEVMAHLSENDLENLFDMGYYLKHVNTIFSQVFDEGKPAS